MAQKLLTKAILATLPKLYAQDGKGMDATVYVKFFNPCGSGTWYITEGEQDGDDFRMFGYVTGMQGDEFGYISLNELSSVKLRFGLKIERDYHFTPKTIAECVKSGA